VWALWALVPLTVFVAYKCFLEDETAIYHWMNFKRTTVVARPAAGYEVTPPYHPHPHSAGGGYHDPYFLWRYDGDWLSYVAFEVPVWDDWYRGRTAGPLPPPMVRRYMNLAVAPEIAFGTLAVAWGLWTWRVVLHRRRLRVRPRGFELLPADATWAPVDDGRHVGAPPREG
jgi:hypothetical protein